MKKKLLKVVFEYENAIETLEGKEAQKWMDACNSQLIVGWTHGSNFPKFNWKVEKKSI